MKTAYTIAAYAFLLVSFAAAMIGSYHAIAFTQVAEHAEASRHLLGSALMLAIWAVAMVGTFTAHRASANA